MNTNIKLFCVTALLFVLGCSGDKTVDSRLYGTWKYTRLINSGKETPADILEKAPTVSFEGNKMITKNGDKVVSTWTYTVDTSFDPHRMTITMGEPGEEKNYNEHYKIEGDTLTMCSTNKKFSRPFNTKLESGVYFNVRTRVN